MKFDKLTPFEWEIMKIFWEENITTVREVVDALPLQFQRAYTTVQTYVERLVDKDVLSKEKKGKVNHYHSLIPRQSAVINETDSMVNKVFNGSFSSLAAYLVHSGKLDDKDFEELQQMIRDAKEKNNV